MTIDPTQAYRVLGLHPGATLDDVKMAFRDLAQVWHPDRFPENDRLREKAMHNQQLINEAYAVLQKYRPPASHGAVSVATPPRPMPAPPLRHVKHSVFTGVAGLRNSLKVLWPSATYARKRRRRRFPRTWIALAVLGLLILAAALWQAGLLGF